MNGSHPISMSRHQRGAVLLVSMIMLLVLTLIGVSAMSTATIEEKMAANAQQKAITFQAAESAIDDTIDDTALLSTAISSASPVSSSVSLGFTGVTATSMTELLGQAPAPGYSLGSGSQTQFVAYSFEVVGTGTLIGTSLTTDAEQGIIRIAPGGN